MTFEQTKEMITFLRENGAIQVNVEGVSATFADVARDTRYLELKPENDPDALPISAEEREMDEHVMRRFGFSTQEIMGG